MILAEDTVSEDERVLALVLVMYPPEERAVLVRRLHANVTPKRIFAVPAWFGLSTCIAALATVFIGQPKPDASVGADRSRFEAGSAPVSTGAHVSESEPVAARQVQIRKAAVFPKAVTSVKRRAAREGVEPARVSTTPASPKRFDLVKPKAPSSARRIASRVVGLVPAPREPQRPVVETYSRQGEGNEMSTQANEAERAQDLRDASEAIRTLRLR